MRAEQWIDRVRKDKGLPSDYAAAKVIGISRFTVSGYRNRPGATLDEDVSFRIANLLGLDPAGVIIDQAAERSKDQSIRAALSRIADRLCILCKVGFVERRKTPRAPLCAAFML